jgi:predicted ATP-grasp superfamily ATP-dependent carboligase
VRIFSGRTSRAVFPERAPARNDASPAGRSRSSRAKAFKVLLLDGESPYALAVARCLSFAPAVKLDVLSSRKWAPLRFSRGVSSFVESSGWETREAAAQSAALASAARADLWLATAESAIGFLVRERQRLPVPHTGVPPRQGLEIGRDKWQLKCFLDWAALPHPATELCTQGAGSLERLAALRFPVLIKPRFGGNGAGIRKVADITELIEYVRTADLWDRAVAQTFIQGQDIDCSVLCAGGEIRAYTIQRGFTPTPAFRPPGGVEFLHDDRVLTVVRELMAALAWDGVAHVDLRYSKGADQINVIEVNPRFWGSVLASLHAGVNFPYLACLTALGEPFDIPAFHPCRYVAGGTALRHWARGKVRARESGFSLSDTLFWYARGDPVPTILEPFLSGSG